MIWVAMIIAGLLTFAARFSMIGLIGNRPIPATMQKLLVYVGPSVMAAIILPATLIIDGQIMFADNPKIPALIIAGIVALVTSNVLATISTGMIVLWLINHGALLI